MRGPTDACRRSSNSILSLNIPVEAAINQEAVALYKEREAKRQKLKEEQVRIVFHLVQLVPVQAYVDSDSLDGRPHSYVDCPPPLGVLPA